MLALLVDTLDFGETPISEQVRDWGTSGTFRSKFDIAKKTSIAE
jgi:hypothetical protein